MTGLAIAQIALWVVVLGLALVVVSLMRQTGMLLERVAPAGMDAARKVFKVGDAVDPMSLKAASGDSVGLGGPNAVPQLLFFLSPECAVCKTMLPDLRTFAADNRRRVQVIVASAGTLNKALPKQLNLQDMPCVSAETLAQDFGVSQLPHVVVIAPSGQVSSSQLLLDTSDFKTITQAALNAADSSVVLARPNSISGSFA